MKLANNNIPEEKPKVSKLPLPISDSPLVIDLPDGQKIVIGKMTQGSVIEVATWRGIGRPDSRTSRLMLGVGNGNVDEEQSSDSGQSSVAAKAKKPNDWRVIFYFLNIAIATVKRIPISSLIKKLSPSTFFAKAKAKKTRSTKQSPELVPSVGTSMADNGLVGSQDIVDEDIEAWLNRISEKASSKVTEATVKPKSTVKKSAPTKKTAKRAATSKSKRK